MILVDCTLYQVCFVDII